VEDSHSISAVISRLHDEHETLHRQAHGFVILPCKVMESGFIPE
jgi:hypothetical protein